MKTYKGSCHCGKVKFEVQSELKPTIDCNCSMCKRKGTILTFVSPESFKLISGEDSLTHYHFNKHVIDHTFCKVCGVTSFASGKDPKGNFMNAVNVRCLEDVDLNSLEIVHVDGKSF
jgi:hypothetical protein